MAISLTALKRLSQKACAGILWQEHDTKIQVLVSSASGKAFA